MTEKLSNVGIVVIGRNEGERLVRCLQSAARETEHMIYVDSGSTDDSVAKAESLGAAVVNLDLSITFTAARARNAGWRELISRQPALEFVHFIDGDCEFVDGWIEKAHDFLTRNKEYAVVCGRRCERFPNETTYNKLCDIEWNTPVGDATACGGDALFRVDALKQSNGYRDDFIAGEEPELCFRLREQGWKIYRMEGDMTMHDAAMSTFGQWWKRTKRCGFAYALGASVHGRSDEKYWVAETRRAVVWGGIIPALIILASLTNPLFLMAFGVYPLQWMRIARSSTLEPDVTKAWAYYTVIGKFPEFMGVAEFYWKKVFKKEMKLIEYK